MQRHIHIGWAGGICIIRQGKVPAGSPPGNTQRQGVDSWKWGREGVGASFVKGRGFLPFSSSIGTPFLPVSCLLFTRPLRKCFDNSSFLFNVNWNRYISSPMHFLHISPICHCGIKVIFPLFKEFLASQSRKDWCPPLPFFPGKSLSHPLKSHLLGNCLQCCREEPDSAFELTRSGEVKSYRHISARHMFKKPTKSWPKWAFH